MKNAYVIRATFDEDFVRVCITLKKVVEILEVYCEEEAVYLDKEKLCNYMKKREKENKEYLLVCYKEEFPEIPEFLGFQVQKVEIE